MYGLCLVLIFFPALVDQLWPLPRLLSWKCGSKRCFIAFTRQQQQRRISNSLSNSHPSLFAHLSVPYKTQSHIQTHTMARKSKSLIRYIFRHGPHVRARSDTSPSERFAQEPVNPPEPVTLSRRPTPDDAPDSPLAYKSRSESRQSTNLEDIAEETVEPDQDTDDSSSNDDSASIAETLAALDLDINTFTTRGLISASVAEARMGNDAHLVTIDTILALLDALDGFSATVTILRTEMEEKKRVCEEKLAMLDDVERAVSQMEFGEEEEEGGSADMVGH